MVRKGYTQNSNGMVNKEPQFDQNQEQAPAVLFFILRVGQLTSHSIELSLSLAGSRLKSYSNVSNGSADQMFYLFPAKTSSETATADHLQMGVQRWYFH